MSKNILIGVIALAVIATGFYAFNKDSNEFAGVSVGLEATLAVTSQISLTGGTISTIIATSSSCGARVITTKASPILLTFSEKDNDEPSEVFGHLQAASTTVVYDAEDFGCDKIKGLTADGTNTVITISDFR